MTIFPDFPIQNTSKEDENYPKSLLDLKNPPSSLYYRGDLSKVDFSKCLAVVGSRRMTTYGRQVLEKFIPDLVSAGVTVVSGFMYGVDTLAHKLTVDCGGKTIAIMGNGLDVAYPVENRNLYSDILNTGGLVLSEYQANVKPHLWTYPARNRIVAAISLLGVLIIEAGESSGSLVTAKWARSLKRKVYAVPGAITSSGSIGTNQLLQSRHAIWATKPGDIIRSEQQNSYSSMQSVSSALEAKIYRTLMRENFTPDELSIVLGVDISILSAEISLMTLKGLIEEIGGKFVIKSLPNK